MKKKLMAILLCIGMLTGTSTPLVAEEAEDFVITQSETYADGEIEFLVPVEQQTEVPEEYIGIYTAEDLDNVRNDLNANYILMNDIDLSEYENWKPISDFRGIFDGNGFTISNLVINITNEDTDYSGIGLFSFVYDASILNLSMQDCHIHIMLENTINARVGLISGELSNSEIDNCIVSGEIEYTNEETTNAVLEVGGVSGYVIRSSVQNIKSEVNINVDFCNAPAYVGGMFGWINDMNGDFTINNLQNEGKVTVCENGLGCCGGISGSLDFYNTTSTVENIINSGDLQYQYARNDAYKTSEGRVGGVFGVMSAYDSADVDVSNLLNTANIQSDSAECGGIVGSFQNPTGIGGSFDTGISYVEFKQLYNSGMLNCSDIFALTQYEYQRIGGLFGVINCTETESSDNNCSFVNITISDSYNSGYIRAVHESDISIPYISGIIGMVNENIEKTYNNLSLINIYNVGIINVLVQDECNANIHDIVGLSPWFVTDEIDITSCYYPSYSNANCIVDGCTSLSDTEMQSASSFVGFDFDTVWEIGVTDGYPYPTLRNNPHSGGNILKCPTLTVYPGSASTQTHFEWYKAEAPDAVKFYLEVCDVVDDVYPVTVTASDATMYTVTMPQEPGSYTATLYALYEDGSRIKGNTVAYTVAGEIENPVYGKTYAQTTLKKLELDSISEDSVIYNNPPYLAFSGQYTGVFHMIDGDTDTKVSFKYLTENGYIKIKPDSKGLYPTDTFGGVIEEFQIKVNDDGTLRISACIPLFTDGVENTMGWTCWGDCFAATNLSGTENVICNDPTDYAGNYRSFTVRFTSMPTSAYLQFDNQHDASKWLEEDYCASNVLFRIDLDEIVENNEQLIYTTEFRIHSEGLASENYMRKVRVVAEYTGEKSVSEAHSFQVKPIPEREANNTIGCPYEQTSSPEESVDKPAVLNVTNTAGKGEHRILSVVNYDCDAAAAPFFWWKADCGTFYKISDDFKKVGFIPNGSGTVTVYMGDGLGYVTSYALTIEN